MKPAILTALTVVAVLLLAILYLLFAPLVPLPQGRVSDRDKEAIVGKAMIEAAHRDPAAAKMIARAMKLAPAPDQAKVADVLAGFPAAP